MSLFVGFFGSGKPEPCARIRLVCASQEKALKVPMRHIRAKTIFPGRVRGMMVEYQRERFSAAAATPGATNPKSEYRHFKTALRSAQLQLAGEKKMMLDRRKKNPAEIQALDDAIDVLESHIMTLDDPYFLGEIKNRIFNTGANAAAALGAVIGMVSRQFNFDENAQNSHFLKDMGDMKRRILYFLGLGNELKIPEGASVVAAAKLTVSEVLALKRAGARAIILGETSDTAHELVMLRAVRIPSISISDSRFFRIKKAQPIIVDADIGYAVLNPKLGIPFTESNIDAPLLSTIATTKSRVKIKVTGTLHFANELSAYSSTTQGEIGLYRTEYQISEARELVSHKQLTKTYTEILAEYPKIDTTFRLFDLSADKNFLAHPIIEKNHSVRGMRFLVAEKKLLESQITALLRASEATGRSLNILLPYTTDIEQIKIVKAQIAHRPKIKLGAMLENVASVFSAKLWVDEIDFFYVGTSDLMSSIAHERREATEILQRALLSEAFSALALELNRLGTKRPMTLCGELTAEPWAILHLVSLGFTRFVVPTHRIKAAANMAEALTSKALKSFAKHVREIAEIDRLEYARTEALEILYGRP